MNFHDAEKAVRLEDETAAAIRDCVRARARQIIVHAIENVQGSRLRRPDRPQETADGITSANFGLTHTNEFIVMTATEAGEVEIERGVFGTHVFRRLRNSITVASVEDAMKALVRLSSG